MPFAAVGVVGVVRMAAVGQSGLALSLILVVIGAVGAVALVGVPVINGLSAKNATVFLSDQHVGRTDWLGRRRCFDRCALGGILLCSVRLGGGTTAYTIFIRPEGTCLFTLASRQWALADLQRLADAVGVPLHGSWDDVATPDVVNREVPGTFSRAIAGISRVDRHG